MGFLQRKERPACVTGMELKAFTTWLAMKSLPGPNVHYPKSILQALQNLLCPKHRPKSKKFWTKWIPELLEYI